MRQVDHYNARCNVNLSQHHLDILSLVVYEKDSFGSEHCQIFVVVASILINLNEFWFKKDSRVGCVDSRTSKLRVIGSVKYEGYSQERIS